MVGRPRKYGEETVSIWTRIPRSWKKLIEDNFGSTSEFLRSIIEKELSKLDSESLKQKLIEEKEELQQQLSKIKKEEESILSKLEEVELRLKQLESTQLIEVTDEEHFEITDWFKEAVEAINNNGRGWRAELTPEQAIKRLFKTFVDEKKLDILTAKKKVLRVFPELEGVI
ncbi:hypothetical protein DRP05_11640 [Archaeoglobales archaeon]|nr:MAG: hypothetical protein DRP05_11640 [Archaeoglobales archaeon]